MTEWWRSAVIYQIYPRSFLDSSGDGIGDLPGITEKLDYVTSLGVDAVWISPFFKSPMKDFGYDISDYCEIDPMFGTLDNFSVLLAEAHQRGLKVLIDQVWNHTSSEHAWFVESRKSRDNAKADWYVWADPKPDGTPPNNWLATFGGSAWEWEPRRQQYYLHNFLVEQPDLNWYNPEVEKALLDVARFWLDLGVDGFRLDVVNFYTHSEGLEDNPLRLPEEPLPAGASPQDPFFSQKNLYNICRPETIKLLPKIRRVLDEYGATISLAEVSSAEDTLLTSSEYVQGNERLHTAYNSALMTDEPLTAPSFTKLITEVEKLFPNGGICWTAGTHDFPRLKSRLSRHSPNDEFLQEAFDHLFIALQLSLRGCTCIYQGDELGLTQADIPLEKMRDPFGIQGYPTILGRDGSRTPMPWCAEEKYGGFTTGEEPWLPLPPDHLARAVDLQEEREDSLLNKYRKLIAWRSTQPTLQHGSLELLSLREPLLGFTRTLEEESILCLFNLAAEPLYESLEKLPSTEALEGSGFSDRLYHHTLELPPFGVYFGVVTA